LLPRLACPECGQALSLEADATDGGRIRTGSLTCPQNHRFPIEGFVPRFVPDDAYAASFGMQWNRFRQTQIDRFNRTRISLDRFQQVTGWDLQSLAGQWILDAGCGAGRFAQIALDAGAEVIAVDLSRAVDACYQNLGPHERLHVVQASIYALPFRTASLDRAYSIGVLQHTPDVGRAVRAIPPLLKPGGILAFWIYERKLLSQFWIRRLLRIVTTRMDANRLFRLVERNVPWLLKLSNALAVVPVLGSLLRKLVPVANYRGALPLTEAQLREWALLDTFDWLSPAYDAPQRFEDVRTWLSQAGCKKIGRRSGRHLGLAIGATRE
jgi:2-polyprenyl-3-methyl-5-hydroxy-6-metoxy-1,4-benzoquinol methylase